MYVRRRGPRRVAAGLGVHGALAAALVAIEAQRASADPPEGWTVTDLGPAASVEGYGPDINNGGDIVFNSAAPGGAVRAFVRSGGTTTSLGALGDTAVAAEINDEGTVSGIDSSDPFSATVRTFRWSPPSPTRTSATSVRR